MPGSDGVRDVAQDHWRLDRCDALGGDSKPGISWELARQSPFGATTRAPSHCLREEMRNIANCSKALQVLRRRPVCPDLSGSFGLHGQQSAAHLVETSSAKILHRSPCIAGQLGK